MTVSFHLPFSLFITVACCIWYSGTVCADVTVPPIEEKSTSVHPKENTGSGTSPSPLTTDMFNELDVTHKELGSGLASMAQWIDAFFGDDRAYEDANKSQGQITLDTTKKETDNVQFDLRVRAKVLLPRTQKKLRLLIDSDAPELGQDPNVSNSLATTVQSTSFSLAIETLLPVLREWNVAPALGIKADWPPDLYARIRATRYFDIQPWLSRFSTKASWYAIAGPIVTVSLDFDRPLDPDWFSLPALTEISPQELGRA